MENKVIIKCFETPKCKYFYDRYSNTVVRVDNKEYDVLKEIEFQYGGIEGKDIVLKFVNSGLLKKTRIQEIKHPEEENIDYWVNEQMSHLILQVTQQCNLRCSYCAYSGNYYNREHSNQRMGIDIARKAIDYYIAHANSSEKYTIGFYGGEPLLEFDLIRQCVDYCLIKRLDRPIKYQMTTNATLLTADKVAFCEKYGFDLLISLDGDKNEHDINRKFRNGQGSFDTIIDNLKALRCQYPWYYREHVRFNTVVNPKVNLPKVLDFIKYSSLFEPGQNTLNTVSPVGLKRKELREYNCNYWIPEAYELLKVMLYMLGKMPREDTNYLYRMLIFEINRVYRELEIHSTEGIVEQHGGPCIPGARRVFVTVAGELYPCERVSEQSEFMCIGTLEEGFNYKNMKYLLNGAAVLREKCKCCWNIRLCKICTAELDVCNKEIFQQLIDKRCCKSKAETLNNFRILCILLELGYVPMAGEEY